MFEDYDLIAKEPSEERKKDREKMSDYLNKRYGGNGNFPAVTIDLAVAVNKLENKVK